MSGRSASNAFRRLDGREDFLLLSFCSGCLSQKAFASPPLPQTQVCRVSSVSSMTKDTVYVEDGALASTDDVVRDDDDDDGVGDDANGSGSAFSSPSSLSWLLRFELFLNCITNQPAPPNTMATSTTTSRKKATPTITPSRRTVCSFGAETIVAVAAAVISTVSMVVISSVVGVVVVSSVVGVAVVSSVVGVAVVSSVVGVAVVSSVVGVAVVSSVVGVAVVSSVVGVAVVSSVVGVAVVSSVVVVVVVSSVVVISGVVDISSNNYNHSLLLTKNNRHRSTVSGLIRLVISLECFVEITPDYLCPFMND